MKTSKFVLILGASFGMTHAQFHFLDPKTLLHLLPALSKAASTVTQTIAKNKFISAVATTAIAACSLVAADGLRHRIVGGAKSIKDFIAEGFKYCGTKINFPGLSYLITAGYYLGADSNTSGRFLTKHPLIEAVLKNNVRAIFTLIRCHANMNIHEQQYLLTPMHYAALAGNVDAVQALIGAQAYIDPTDDKSATPLHAAAYAGHIKVVKMLIENGARLSAKDSTGHTFVDYAREKHHDDIVNEFENVRHV